VLQTSQRLHAILSHNTIWCGIAHSKWPECRLGANAGMNWKQICLLNHSKTAPHLPLNDYENRLVKGKHYLVGMVFVGDDSDMGNAESMLFLQKISKGAPSINASPKGDALCMEYGSYYFISMGITAIQKVPMFWDRCSAVVIPILRRSTHNTNVESVFTQKHFTDVNSILQQVHPNAPLIVFFHYNPINNATSNSTSDSAFVQDLVDLFRKLIMNSDTPYRKLLVQPYNFRSGYGFSDGLWWMVSNMYQHPLLREQVQLVWRG